MLATFVIGLREGLEAALIVGIIAAFLKQGGNSRALRQMWIGVALAVALCLGIGIALGVLSGALPQRQQEMLEAVIGLVAMAMVTLMVLWMRKHSKDLRRELGNAVGGALAQGTSIALVGMAFLAVVREGVETAVFLVAASQTSAGTTTFVGAAMGIAVATVLGYLIYRGGVKLNLSRFFRITGVVLVLVAGGVLMSSLYHAYEAGWITIGNQVWLDFSSFISPGSVQGSLLGGLFGIRAQVRAIEVLSWLLYVVPMLVVVLWPPRRRVAGQLVGRVLVALGATAVLATVLLATLIFRPGGTAAGQDFSLAEPGPAGAPGIPVGRLAVTPQTVAADHLVVRLTGSLTVAGSGLPVPVDILLTAPLSGAGVVGGRPAVTFSGTPIAVPTGGPVTITAGELAELNGGRYPVGLRAAQRELALQSTQSLSVQPTVSIDRSAAAVLSVELRVVPVIIATQPGGQTHRVNLPDSNPAADPSTTGAAVTAAADRSTGLSRAATLGALIPWLLGVWGVLLIGCGLLVLLRSRRPAAGPRQETAPSATVEAAQQLPVTTSGV